MKERLAEAVATNAPEMVSGVPAVASNGRSQLQLPSLWQCRDTRALLGPRHESLRPDKPWLRGQDDGPGQLHVMQMDW